GETDRSGNFSLPYAYGTYVAAQAFVSAAPGDPVELEIVASNRSGESISDEFIYLILREGETPTTAASGEQEHCDCERPVTAKRLPDQADLIGSDEYTQDIGGTCLNLT